jgi:uncharacterized protein YndB with AHSA1/START domain
MSTVVATEGDAARDLVVTRHFDAPVERVWRAWVDGSQVKRWWGPRGFTAPMAEMDVRDGGTSLVSMRSPDGHEFYNTWSYDKVVPNQRLEFVSHFADEHGNKVSRSALGLPAGIPDGVPHVITFSAAAHDGTELTVTEHGYTSDQALEASKAGLEQCLDKMEELLATG